MTDRKIAVFPIPDRPSAKRAVQKILFAKLIKKKFVSDYATDLKQNVRVKLFLLINFIDLSKIFNGWSRHVLLILSMKGDCDDLVLARIVWMIYRLVPKMFITRIAIHKTTHQSRCLIPVVGDDSVDKIANVWETRL